MQQVTGGAAAQYASRGMFFPTGLDFPKGFFPVKGHFELAAFKASLGVKEFGDLRPDAFGEMPTYIFGTLQTNMFEGQGGNYLNHTAVRGVGSARKPRASSLEASPRAAVLQINFSCFFFVKWTVFAFRAPCSYSSLGLLSLRQQFVST